MGQESLALSGRLPAPSLPPPTVSQPPVGLTAEAEDSLSADDCAHGVGGEALVDASILGLAGVHDDQVAADQLLAGARLQLHLGAVHLPPAVGVAGAGVRTACRCPGPPGTTAGPHL